MTKNTVFVQVTVNDADNHEPVTINVNHVIELSVNPDGTATLDLVNGLVVNTIEPYYAVEAAFSHAAVIVPARNFINGTPT